uniref:HK97-gp10 family putative phage morphogenesis protein n=1 Tax=Hafnia alvei TaxID=569 RepID=UPI00242E017F|nr:HK97-gp10 family putative phage morphogenesis protein [Hafnia alvei]
MDITMQFPSGKDFDRLLSEMEKKVGVEMLRDAGRTALAVVEADMKQHAGYDENSHDEHMRDSIKIRSTNRMNDNRYRTVITLKVGPSDKHYMKAAPQEFGTVKQVAKPFIRPALDYNKQQVLKVLAIEIRYALENR